MRLIIETVNEQSLEIFQTKSVSIADRITFAGLLEIKIGEINYHLFIHKNDDLNKNYLVIESLQEMGFELFEKDCESILLAIGFVTGNFHQKEHYYQVITEDNITIANGTKYVLKKDSIISNTALLDPHKWRTYVNTLKQNNQLTTIPSRFEMRYFNSLCEKIKKNSRLQRTIKLLLEGSQTKLFLLKAGIYSIALETLTNLIYEENEEKINPIKEKELSDLLKKKFRVIIEEYESFIGDYGTKILESKINDLNRPTNSKKLLKPFEIYGIRLNKDEKLILSHRNKFLHGTSPFKESEVPHKSFEVTNISYTLLVLISCLIFKYVGYRGYVLNLGDWHNYSHKREIKDHLFRLI